MGAVAAHIDDRHGGNELTGPPANGPSIRPGAEFDIGDNRPEPCWVRFDRPERITSGPRLDDLKAALRQRIFQEVDNEGSSSARRSRVPGVIRAPQQQPGFAALSASRQKSAELT